MVYEEVALNCFAYFGFKSFDEVDRLTLDEYELLFKARALKEVEDDYYIHKQAFANFRAKATTKKGKPVYKRFNKLFNYKKIRNEVLKAIGYEQNQGNPQLEALSKHKKEVKNNG